MFLSNVAKGNWLCKKFILSPTSSTKSLKQEVSRTYRNLHELLPSNYLFIKKFFDIFARKHEYRKPHSTNSKNEKVFINYYIFSNELRRWHVDSHRSTTICFYSLERTQLRSTHMIPRYEVRSNDTITVGIPRSAAAQRQHSVIFFFFALEHGLSTC